MSQHLQSHVGADRKSQSCWEVLGPHSGDSGQLALRKKEVTPEEQLPNYHTAYKASGLWQDPCTLPLVLLMTLGSLC